VLWPKKLAKGETITEEWIASVVDAITSVVRPAPPLRFERNRKGVTLTIDQQPGFMTCKSPGGGIAPGATALCYRFKAGDPGTLLTSQVSIYNPGPDAVPGSRRVWYGTSDGVANSALWWSCQAVS
jgi:hypothetical protein